MKRDEALSALRVAVLMLAFEGRCHEDNGDDKKAAPVRKQVALAKEALGVLGSKEDG